MSVSRKLHYCGSSYYPGYTSDFLGIPIDLGYQLRDFSVSVLTWKMGLRIREILIAIPNNHTKFSLHFRFLQALQGEHSFPLPDMILKVENIVYNELLIRGYNVDVGIVEVCAKNDEGKTTRKQFEVDFVVNQGSQRYYIQVAYDMTSEEKQKQEFNSFRNIPDSFKKIVVMVLYSKKVYELSKEFLAFLLKKRLYEFTPIEVSKMLGVTNKTIINRCAKTNDKELFFLFHNSIIMV